MPPIEPTAADLARLRPIADRASLVMAVLAERPSLVNASDLTLSAAAGTGASVASAATRVLVSWGWIEETGGSPRQTVVPPERLLALSHRLRGVADAAAMDEGPPMVEAVVTLPLAGGALRAALSGRLDAHATRDGFGHVAASARSRLVFLVPFVDAVGAQTLIGMLSDSQATDRIVIVRPDSRGVRWHFPHLPALRHVGARVLEYWRAPLAGAPPNLKVETFHAKIALADREFAYVGSSNLMASSLDGSLECGVLVRGEPARVFATLVDAVVAMSTSVVPS